MCFNCGKEGHPSRKCPLPKKGGPAFLTFVNQYLSLLNQGGATFAKCFICGKVGHLSRSCPDSTHGVYPKVCMPSCPFFKGHLCPRVAAAKFAEKLRIWCQSAPKRVLPPISRLGNKLRQRKVCLHLVSCRIVIVK